MTERRTVTVTMALEGAWEVWAAEIDDADAPDEITLEWCKANPDKVEFLQLRESGSVSMEFTEVEED